MSLKDTLKDRLENLDTGHIFDVLGMQRRHVYTTTDLVLPAVGIFSAGLLVGIGVGLMIAPKSGQELRGDISHKVHDLGERSQKLVQDAATKARNRLQQRQDQSGRSLEAANTEANTDNPYA